MRWGGKIAAIAGCLAVAVAVAAKAAGPLAYETIQPPKITIGESAMLKVTSLDGDLETVALPEVAGLAFEVVGHTRQMEFVSGTILASTSIMIRVTPKFTGVYSIPGLTPKSQPLILEVSVDHSSGNAAAAGAHPGLPEPSVVAGTATANGVHLKADGSAFVQLIVPKRAVYVGESVPVDIEVGVRPGIVTSLNGLPTLKGGEFTLNNLSRQPDRQQKIIDGRAFLVMTWHSLLAAVKPGDFSLSVETPLTVKITSGRSEDEAFANLLGGPFLGSFYNSIVPKEITIASPPSALTVLALPTDGRPPDFGGAVGTFKISSDISTPAAEAGDPLTLRMHITGSGNFDRVDSAMLDHLDHWKTYPPKSSFTSTDPLKFKGEKIFEQPLIAAQTGEQAIPELSFSYFDPETRRYQRARSAPIRVSISAALADTSLDAPRDASGPGSPLAGRSASPLRPDHALSQAAVGSLVPLGLQPRFLGIPATLAVLFAGGWLGLRRGSRRVSSKTAQRTLAQLDAAARSGDTAAFFTTARAALLQNLAARWQMTPEEIIATELAARRGPDVDEIRRLFALADEAIYSGHDTNRADFTNWLQVLRHQLSEQAP